MSKTEYPDLPRVAVGALVIHENHLLLVRRGNSPGRGTWAVPGGSIRLGETLRHAVERETMEETGLRIRADHPVHTFDLIQHDPKDRIRYHYVIVDFIGRYLSGELRPGDDALEARWVAIEDLHRYEVNRITRELVEHVVVRNTPPDPG